MSTSWTSERAKLAALSRHHSGDTEAIDQARRDLRAARLEDHVSKVLAEAPPFTAEQRRRLAALLNGAANA